MADWVTISSLATAGGTLVLAVATFSSVRSANRSARIAEQSLLLGLRPILIPSRDEDPSDRIGFGDGMSLTLGGHGGAAEVSEKVVYMGLSLRNGGAGVAVIHGWRASSPPLEQSRERPDLDEFRTQQIDLFIPAGESGHWLGALRDPDDARFAEVGRAVEGNGRLIIDLIYGDHEGGQRTIARFGLVPDDDVAGGRRANVLRYWNLDRDDPRDHQ
jgi:hypothetical protein